MKRRPIAAWMLVALGLAQLPVAAQQDTPDVRKPFRMNDEDRPPPRAIPVKPIPRAIPVPPKGGGAAPAPDPAPVSAPKPMTAPEPGDITIAPQAKGTPDALQLSLADGYYEKKQYEMAAPEYEKYLG